MAQKLLKRLKANFEFFSTVEKQIAQVILDDPEKFISYTMVELADVAEVSQGSIINFSKKFSNGGFPVLKLEIAANIAEFKNKPFSVVDKQDNVKDVLQKVIDNSSDAFKNTAECNEEETFQNVVNKILKAKKIEIYGIFQSGLVANDFYFQLLQMGIPAAYVSDLLSCTISASMLDSECLLIIFSSSGRTKEMIDAAKAAKENNASVVCVTSNKKSPLAKLSDDVLVATSSGSSVSGRMSEIRLSQLFITDVLCSYLRSKIDEHGEKHYFGLKDIINSHNVEE